MPDLTPANQAIEEIKAILAKYDLAAEVMVQSPREMAFLHKIDPTWSCAFFLPSKEGLQLRFRAKQADYPSREAWQEAISATTGMIMSFRNHAERTTTQLTEVAVMLSNHFGFQHWERENEA